MEKIIICANCSRACCFQGKFMCDKAERSETIEMTLQELRNLNLEHPHYWSASLKEQAKTNHAEMVEQSNKIASAWRTARKETGMKMSIDNYRFIVPFSIECFDNNYCIGIPISYSIDAVNITLVSDVPIYDNLKFIKIFNEQVNL